MRSANPALKADTFDFAPTAISDPSKVMTLQGTVGKTFLLLLLMVGGASLTWASVMSGGVGAGIMPWLLGGLIGGLVFAIVTVVKKTWAPFTAPLYAIFEGLLLGGISAFFEMRYPGIVIQAVSATFATAFALLFAYTSGVIKATENFKLGVTAATGGIFLMYMASWILGMFGIGIPFIHDSGPIGIAVSAVIVVIAALNLVLDFDFIEEGTKRRAPKYMEWYGAFGLVVTLVWLYLEMLRLLSKLQSRN